MPLTAAHSEEIADCCEAAYDALPKAAAARVLFLEDAAGLAECVPPDPLLLRRPTNQPHRLIGKRNWAVDGPSQTRARGGCAGRSSLRGAGDIITFPEAQGEAEAIAPETLIERTLGYASELEKIV